MWLVLPDNLLHNGEYKKTDIAPKETSGVTLLLKAYIEDQAFFIFNFL
jgi:hypothetical protein